jgi:hypothetical protein
MDLLRRRSPCSYTGSQCPTVADSVIGLINLLYEVKMPHIKMQPMAYSTPADSPNRNRSSNANKSFKNNIFSLFSPSQYMAKKERKNLIHLSKNYCRRRRFLSYHLLSKNFLLSRLFYFLFPISIGFLVSIRISRTTIIVNADAIKKA